MSVLELAKWLLVDVATPFVRWLFGRRSQRVAVQRNSDRRRERNIRMLCGLPPEAKAELVNFHDQRTHTLRLNPGDPVVQLLVDRGILILGPGGGTYDAVDRYATVRPQFWEVVDDWLWTEALTAHEKNA